MRPSVETAVRYLHDSTRPPCAQSQWGRLDILPVLLLSHLSKATGCETLSPGPLQGSKAAMDDS